MMNRNEVGTDFLLGRLKAIEEGFIEGISREVERRRRLGIPLYVAKGDGVEKIILDKPSGSPTTLKEIDTA
jgi:hypothetical protein